MEIRNAGYNHCHDTDFIIDRPKGSGDNLLLLLKTDCIVTLDGVDQLVPANSVFLYPKDAPQFYRTCPQQLFANDWVHFLFEGEEFSQFSARKIPFQTPIPVQEPNFFSHCIKEIVYETYSQNLYRKESASCYMTLIWDKLSEQLYQNPFFPKDSRYEMLATIRRKMYRSPWDSRTVDNTAHEVRMSRSAFQKLYKQFFGITFTQDLIQSRMEYAAMLLQSTDLGVAKVAEQCGYRHYEHFERQFLKRYGISPKAYRTQDSPLFRR